MRKHTNRNVFVFRKQDSVNLSQKRKSIRLVHIFSSLLFIDKYQLLIKTSYKVIYLCNTQLRQSRRSDFIFFHIGEVITQNCFLLCNKYHKK